MKRWTIQFSQLFNGYISQSMVEVDADDIHDALAEFNAIGYVNATVNGIWRCRRENEELKS